MAKPKVISLEDILPAKPEFMLGGRIFKLRPPNMLDQVWIKTTWGAAFANILPEEDWPQVARFVYHQLDHAGQTHFRARKVPTLNELTGEEGERFCTGAEVLLASIANQQEFLAVLGAVYRAIAISNPLVEEIAKKKMEASLARLNPETEAKPTSPESSTRSRTSTDGRKRKSRG